MIARLHAERIGGTTLIRLEANAADPGIATRIVGATAQDDRPVEPDRDRLERPDRAKDLLDRDRPKVADPEDPAGQLALTAREDDPDLVRGAAPFPLKAMESLLAEQPENRELLTALARGFTPSS